MGVKSWLEKKAAEIIKKKSFKVTVSIHQGKSFFSLLTTNLSLGYV